MSAAIKIVSRPVYYSVLKQRCYLTLRAATDAEARALIEKKFPSESAEYENGMMSYPGFHWQEDPQLVRLHRRLKRIILRKFRIAAAQGVST